PPGSQATSPDARFTVLVDAPSSCVSSRSETGTKRCGTCRAWLSRREPGGNLISKTIHWSEAINGTMVGQTPLSDSQGAGISQDSVQFFTLVEGFKSSIVVL